MITAHTKFLYDRTEVAWNIGAAWRAMGIYTLFGTSYAVKSKFLVLGPTLRAVADALTACTSLSALIHSTAYSLPQRWITKAADAEGDPTSIET